MAAGALDDRITSEHIPHSEHHFNWKRENLNAPWRSERKFYMLTRFWKVLSATALVLIVGLMLPQASEARHHHKNWNNNCNNNRWNNNSAWYGNRGCNSYGNRWINNSAWYGNNGYNNGWRNRNWRNNSYFNNGRGHAYGRQFAHHRHHGRRGGWF